MKKKLCVHIREYEKKATEYFGMEQTDGWMAGSDRQWGRERATGTRVMSPLRTA